MERNARFKKPARRTNDYAVARAKERVEATVSRANRVTLFPAFLAKANTELVFLALIVGYFFLTGRNKQNPE